jgi:hypothetical protein
MAIAGFRGSGVPLRGGHGDQGAPENVAHGQDRREKDMAGAGFDGLNGRSGDTGEVCQFALSDA